MDLKDDEAANKAFAQALSDFGPDLPGKGVSGRISTVSAPALKTESNDIQAALGQANQIMSSCPNQHSNRGLGAAFFLAGLL